MTYQTEEKYHKALAGFCSWKRIADEHEKNGDTLRAIEAVEIAEINLGRALQILDEKAEHTPTGVEEL